MIKTWKDAIQKNIIRFKEKGKKLLSNDKNKKGCHYPSERKRTSFRFLKGNGIEIGALHDPIPVNDDTHVIYVDYLSSEDLKKRYQELDTSTFVKVDLIDNGEELGKITDNSLDFIIANHFLEHCENPIGTIRNHLRKIKPDGILYYAVPEKNFTFDKNRPLTDFFHIVEDDKNGFLASRTNHFFEWVNIVEKITDPDLADNRVRVLMSLNYSIHFHVWDIETIFNFYYNTNEYLNFPFRVLHFEQNGNETITIIQKK